MRATLAFSLLVSASVAQRTWIVDAANGAGTDFTDIPPAVAAAASGDTIRIRGAGLRPVLPYTAPLIDGKGLTLIGEGAATTNIEGLLIVRNLASHQSVLLSQFTMGTSLGIIYGTLPVGLRCENCAGPVVAVDLAQDGPSLSPLRGVYDCSLVVFKNCDMQRGAYPIIRSAVLLEGSRFRWPDVTFLSFACGITLERSRLFIVDSLIEGFWGMRGCCTYVYNAAITTTDSDIWLGGGTTLIGGQPPVGPPEPIHNIIVGTPVPGQWIVPPSRFHRESAGITMNGPWPVSIYDVEHVHPIPALRTSVANSVLTIDQRATPNAITVLGIGPLLSPPVIGAEGLLGIQPDQSLLWWMLAPPSGTVRWSFAIPTWLPAGFWTAIQGVELTPQGQFALSNVTVFGPT